MDLSIVIVSWNVKEKLKKNLTALFTSEGDFKFEVFVIDNNSSDQTVAMVRSEFPQVKIIVNKKNLGFAKGCNLGITKAVGRYILLLNPDMQVQKDTLKKMLKWLDNNPQAIVAGCRLIDEQGQIIKQVRRWPGVWDQLAIILKLPHIFPGILKSYIREDFDYNKASKVDSIRGGFFVIRVSANKENNFLDERYFLWFEEVDFCRQVYARGKEVWYTPAAECVDFVGQSFKQVKRSEAQRYFRDSMLKYFKKWQPVWQYYLLKVIWPIGLLLAWGGEKMKIGSRART